MDFLVEIETVLPPSWTTDQRAELLEQERSRGEQLRDDGTLRAIWRLPGRLANVGIWSTSGPGALHEALASLPASPWQTVRVTALAPHPLWAKLAE